MNYLGFKMRSHFIQIVLHNIKEHEMQDLVPIDLVGICSRLNDPLVWYLDSIKVYRQ